MNKPSLHLFVYTVLPHGQRSYVKRLPGYPQEVSVNGVFYHFCLDCSGWIEGEFLVKKVNTLKPRTRSGRRGIDYFCRRCNYKLGFVGLRS